MTVKLGVIGMSEGNGHPYSWSAIINGYDPVTMMGCGFPVIPEYLGQREFPKEAIEDASVSHVWTQDPTRSRHLAKASFIPNVVADFTDMIGEVDGVLLARDDFENHLHFAKPLLEAGLPVYIDKPIGVTRDAVERIFAHQQYPGQIFSCSALKYCNEFAVSQLTNLGSIKHINAVVCKDWDKYAVHVVDPLLCLINETASPLSAAVTELQGMRTVHFQWSSGVSATVSCVGKSLTPIRLGIIGTYDCKELIFEDTFSAFKSALVDFVDGVKRRDVKTPKGHLLRVSEMLELGRKV